MDWQCHVPPQIHIELHSSVDLCPVFYLKDYLYCTEPKKLDGSQVSTLFLGNNKKYMLVCAKMISSLGRKVLCIAKAHMFLGAAASATLLANVSLASILWGGDWTRVLTPARHFFHLYYYYRLAPGFCAAYCFGP